MEDALAIKLNRNPSHDLDLDPQASEGTAAQEPLQDEGSRDVCDQARSPSGGGLLRLNLRLGLN